MDKQAILSGDAPTFTGVAACVPSLKLVPSPRLCGAHRVRGSRCEKLTFAVYARAAEAVPSRPCLLVPPLCWRSSALHGVLHRGGDCALSLEPLLYMRALGVRTGAPWIVCGYPDSQAHAPQRATPMCTTHLQIRTCTTRTPPNGLKLGYTHT